MQFDAPRETSKNRVPALADDQLRRQNNVDKTTASTVSVSQQLTTSLEDRTTMREDTMHACIRDTRSCGNYFVELERVNDRRARGDLSLVARLGGHSAPRTHRTFPLS